MKTLDELLVERRKIDEQIRILKNRAVIYGRAKLDIEHYATSRPDEWYIAIDRIIDRDDPTAGSDMRRYSIIRSQDRSKCIKYIDEIITDLQGLKRAIEVEKGI